MPREVVVVLVALLEEGVATLFRLIGTVRKPSCLTGEELLADQPMVRSATIDRLRTVSAGRPL